MENGNGEFPKRLRHDTHHWVDPKSAVYHIRIRCRISDGGPSLVDPIVAASVLESVHFYTDLSRWWTSVFLLMPDHLPALIAFDPSRNFSRIIGDWKKWHTVNTGIVWQDNFFDHRLRSDESSREKFTYIRQNPVRAGLCVSDDDWPWWTASDSELRWPRE